MKKLILTEKPSVAREIARVLGCKQNQNGAIIGSNYVITWALGHLVTLATPDELNKAWSTWSLETLPMIPKVFETRVIPETSKQYSCVKSWLKSNEISELIIATDAGREGELVARWIIEKAGFNKPIKRLWISSMTDKAIKDGFNKLVDARKYDNLYYSALSRAIADWLVGLNVSRALTCKYNAQLSAGRVQTPTLYMIVNKEEEINKFKPVEYYQLFIKYKGIEFTLQNNTNSLFYDLDQVEHIKEEIKKEKLVVEKVTRQTKNELPPLLYDLTSLQQDANRLYMMGAKLTLDIIQKLYEVDKYLTYPRTDSKYLSQDMYDTIKERVQTIVDPTYKKFVSYILSKPLPKSKRIFDDTKVSDHHAIILTEQKTNLTNLSINEKRIYDLVMKRFIASFMDNHEYNQIKVTIKIGKYSFIASGKEVIKKGWKEVYQQVELDEESMVVMPSFKEKEMANEFGISIKKGLTTPPQRYTEATLLASMEHPNKFVDSIDLKKVLDSVSGIGTPATRADIIERLFSAGYIELKGRYIYPTEKGKQLIKIVPPTLKSPSLTAIWEQRLAKIEKGQDSKNSFIKDMEENTKQLINEVVNCEHTYKHENATKHKCPNCGKTLLEVNNKYGKSLVCMDKSCGYHKVLSKNTNFICPSCKKKLVLVMGSNKEVLICSCGFKENKESFLTKLNDNKNTMNKKTIDIYLKKQEKEIPSNNPFMSLFEHIDK